MIKLLLLCEFDTLKYSCVNAIISIYTFTYYSVAKKRQQLSSQQSQPWLLDGVFIPSSLGELQILGLSVSTSRKQKTRFNGWLKKSMLPESWMLVRSLNGVLTIYSADVSSLFDDNVAPWDVFGATFCYAHLYKQSVVRQVTNVMRQGYRTWIYQNRKNLNISNIANRTNC
jgi:hypothetical protein